MTGQDVLILSKRNAGGVRYAAAAVRAQGYRPVLVSALVDDFNRESCDDHIVIDWDGPDPDTALAELDELLTTRGVKPVGVVNMVEPLIPWQIRIAQRYGLRGAESGRGVLLSKASVRRVMAEKGLSSLPWVAGPAAELDVTAVDFFPAVAKPSKESGSSRLVRRVDNADQLKAHLDAIAKELGPQTEVVVEGFIDGLEFSVDGPVHQGHFEGLVAFEKTEHDEKLLHDAGVSVCPPQNPQVVSGLANLVKTVGLICRHLGLDQAWLHVEGRALPNGTAELVEINPRPGGGMHLAAIRHMTGIDPVSALTQMALPDGWEPPAEGPVRSAESRRLLGMVPVNAREVGRIVSNTTREDLVALPGVLHGYVFDGFPVVSLDRENFIAQALLTADDVPGLRAVADTVLATVRFRIEKD
ncbi:ATP-grasp domain-containing protein [Streptomyces sasae]|uniref:ATP-grasp domain-containing protein n=1 Tax=Streptomyces sasae TaxID=1266772 RepID=UPI00292D74DC|nr:ATP-grasp domain-containing protein [Streptomyces sasae]